MPHFLRILALGDSYTIGEGVKGQDSFPFQLVKRLGEKGLSCELPHIIAKTGWTTSDLIKALESHPVQGMFDLVFLLIGVNNQYQGRPIEEYQKEFNKLLTQSVEYAGGIKDSVFVISIPDYSYTSFANEMDQDRIRRELNEFNRVNREEAARMGVNYIFITDLTRGGLEDPELLAEDKLHPSGKMYRLWADRLSEELVSRRAR